MFLADYNRRANREMYDAVSRLTARARKRDVGSWFGSIHGILNHLIVADIYWLRRYRALAPESAVLGDPRLDPPGLTWHQDLHEDFGALRIDREAVDTLIRAWFEEFPESRYAEVFEYEDSRGTRRRAVAAEAFDFLFVHQVHHRGQVSQALDELGVPNDVADNERFLESGTE